MHTFDKSAVEHLLVENLFLFFLDTVHLLLLLFPSNEMRKGAVGVVVFLGLAQESAGHHVGLGRGAEGS